MAAPLAKCMRNVISYSKTRVLPMIGNDFLNGSFYNRFRRQHCLSIITAQCSTSSATKNEVPTIQVEKIPDKLFKTIAVEVRGHDRAVLDSYQKFVSMVASELNVNVSKIWEPRMNWYMRTLLKSAHVHKKHRVQYEIRTHYRVIELKHLTGSTADTFLEYIQRNLPEGVAMKCTRVEVQRLPEHIHPPHQKSIEEGEEATYLE